MLREGLHLGLVPLEGDEDGLGDARHERRVRRAAAPRVAGRRRPRRGGGGELADGLERRAPVPNSNLQLDFNVSVHDSFDASSSAVLRELDESNRFVQKSAESTSI